MIDKLRAWWFERHGLAGMNGSPADALTRSGWARSVGGANPYLTLFARTGTSRAEAEKAVAELEIHELPSARGCTHYVPAADYALALKVSQGTSEVATLNTAKKWLGFTDKNLEELNDGILNVLQDGPLDPKGIRERLGDLVISFGEEGKKRGQTTSLSIGLGWLQAHGHIRRIPTGGRLDVQSYSYALWTPNPLDGFNLTQTEAYTELARRYFRWIGPAKLSHFQWFSGLGVGASKAAVEPLGLETVFEDYLMLPDDCDAWEVFEAPTDPVYALISSLDSLILHRRDALILFDEADRGRSVPGEKGLSGLGSQDLTANAIVDRGRIIGLWEYDPEAKAIVKMLFVPESAGLKAKIARTEAFIRDELGDARSFSLDSPKSRRAKLDSFASV